MPRMPVSPVRKKSNDLVEEDLLVTEEPLEIRLGFGPVDDRKEEAISVTMRTPGDDHLLALGFLFSEGIISDHSTVLRIEYCQQVKEEERGNVIRVELAPEHKLDPQKWKRNFYTTSSCGVCGKSSIDAVEVLCSSAPPFTERIDESLIRGLPDTMRHAQVVFEHTGGIHAAALFNASGELLLIFEDVGRHNAVDKLIGAMLKQGIDSRNMILVLSGRVGFELVQKAAVAGIPMIVSVGAPSSLAVELAERRGLILYGFVRKGKANRYTKINEDVRAK